MNDETSEPTRFLDGGDTAPTIQLFDHPDTPPAPINQASAPTPRSRNGLVIALAGSMIAGALGAAGGYYAASGGDDGVARGTNGTSVIARVDTSVKPSDSVEAVAEAVLPSVVKINVSGDAGAGSGSGFVISSDGEIVTNYHVVEVAEGGGDITVSLPDGSTVRATVVGVDPVTDIAVIKAEDVTDLTPATLGVSDDLAVGEQVVAIGSPFGLSATVTSGIVSALNRPVSVGDGSSASDTTYPAIQTDAAINPGNSGGPLSNMAGQVVGINSSIRTNASLGGEGGSIGLGFAIPIDQVLPIIEQIRNGETPTHARMGVSVGDSEDGLVFGAGIQEVTPGSAAAEAGLEAGDLVTAVDDHPISGSESLVATIRSYRPGDAVRLTVLRDGKETTLEVTLDSDEDVNP
jgi:putative serine protease PepD